MSVLLHMTAPRSAGYFHRAVANSPVGLHYRSRQESAPVMDAVAAALLCRDAAHLRCLRSRSMRQVLAVQTAVPYALHLKERGFVNFLPWLPTVDPRAPGGLRASPSALFAAGAFARVPLLMGSVMNETDAWLPQALLGSPLSEALLLALVYGLPNATRVLREYGAAPAGSPFARAGRALTDSLMTCYVRHVARLVSAASPGSVRVYQSLFPPSADPTNARQPACTSGSLCHAGDNLFVLGTANYTRGARLTPLEHRLSAAMVTAWTDFAKGNMHPSGGWPTYAAASDESVQWVLSPAAAFAQNASGYHAQQCSMWDAIGYQGQ